MKRLEKVFDILGEILAVVLVIVYVIHFANLNWHFLDGVANGVIGNIIAGIVNYGALVLVAIVGLEAISKRNIVFRILFYVLLAVVVVFMFFPGTMDYLVNLIGK